MIKSSASSGVNSQGGMFGIGAENFCPEKAKAVFKQHGYNPL